MLERLASTLVTNRRRVMVGWVVFVALAVVIGGSTVDRLVTTPEGDGSTESAEVQAVLETLGATSPDVVAFYDGVDPTDPRSRDRQLDHQLEASSPAESGKAAKSPTAGTPLLISERDPNTTNTTTRHQVMTENRVVPVRIAVTSPRPKLRSPRPIWPRTKALMRTDPLT